MTADNIKERGYGQTIEHGGGVSEERPVEFGLTFNTMPPPADSATQDQALEYMKKLLTSPDRVSE